MNTTLLFIISLLSSVASHYWQKRTAIYFACYPGMALWKRVLCYQLMLSVFFLLLGAVTWLYVLRDWSVSMAYPMLSLNLVLVMLISKFSFGEVLSVHHWVGCGVILLGVVVIVASTG
ncbi:putative 4-amino-4-deoxy-L-arabinose-phosphoundecaprenol flippase subunit ArnE [Kushneria pakistanensis]|uniref:4-amino-4-deoxy-L-arabinose-phosphoundecaprenol flippase subunit ArnE n=1 Tax=Kushneria pakistanensis TaxID=1508770 RepID=A0ABQ3FPJ0_9GAMM|nr:EamA family transporter [Kushneria pakistanensis]GHC32985.1 putative 4-amino-4-deoxy-L-arabinose-phosphoundecaprenol flippase subunit ArnE [Kushneria pakistanensis]